MNEIMLITYANSLGTNLKELQFILDNIIKDKISAIHLLPFYPSSADRGFAPLTYFEVDEQFGTWDDILKIAKKYDLMYDFMLNHISRSSKYFQDYLNNENSIYKEMFLDFDVVFKNATNEEIDLIYKRKNRSPYTEVVLKTKEVKKIWCTFDAEQIDLNVNSNITQNFLEENLKFLCMKKAKYIRLDAFAYTTKKRGTNCFFLEPEIWNILNNVNGIVQEFNVKLLPEIHENYLIQHKLVAKKYHSYDFALPMLVLHTLYSKQAKALKHWLKISSKLQFTTLDTHDGIGVVDVYDLLTMDEIKNTQDNIYKNGANVKKIYSTSAYNNLDVYQMNCTYYSALGNDDTKYLLARAIQLFAPGIPQIYYVGLFAGANDLELLEKTKNGRDINRHNFTIKEIENEMKRPVVKSLFVLLNIYRTEKLFENDLVILECLDTEIKLEYSNNIDSICLEVNLVDYSFKICKNKRIIFSRK